MMSFRSVSAMTVGLVLLTAGCIGSADAGDDVDLPVDGVPMRAMDSGSGLNGLWPPNFHANKQDLYTATLFALAGGTTSAAVSPSIVSSTSLVDGNNAAKETFAYAVKCMLQSTKYVEYHAPLGIDHYQGAGIIDPSGWQFQALPPTVPNAAWSPREALFECMMAHLNGFNLPVQIAYQGSFVHPEENIDEYTMFEALWLATDTNSAITLEVFPGDWFDVHCPRDTTRELINMRVCADPMGDCGITVRTSSDRNQRCVGDAAGNWTCDGKPVLKTRLNPFTMGGMYADCTSP